MSNSTNSILLDVGAIVSDLHYGSFVSYWWYSKKSDLQIQQNFILLDCI
jgi:hypothetical protein